MLEFWTKQANVENEGTESNHHHLSPTATESERRGSGGGGIVPPLPRCLKVDHKTARVEQGEQRHLQRGCAQNLKQILPPKLGIVTTRLVSAEVHLDLEPLT